MVHLERDLPTIIDDVADQIVDGDWNMEQYDWEKGWAIKGLYNTDRRTEATRKLIDRAVETCTTEGQLSHGSLGITPYGWEPDWAKGPGEYKGIPDTAPMAEVALDIYDQEEEPRYLDVAHAQYEFLQTIGRTDDGGIPMSRGSKELLTDSLWHMCPFLARYAEVADEPAGYEEAIHQLDEHHMRLFDHHTGLYRQAWSETPNSFAQDTFWARGVGWYTTAAVDTYALLPDGHDGRNRIAERIQTTANALLNYQDASGFWHNTVDDRCSPLETSGTLMFVYTLKRGIELGILPETSFEGPAEKAFQACTGVVDEKGQVRRTAVVPGGPDAPLGVALHGQGFYLLTADLYL